MKTRKHKQGIRYESCWANINMLAHKIFIYSYVLNALSGWFI